jgi:hypothetical protein
MNETAIQDMMGKLDEGSCWGSWSVSDQACSKCVIMAQCSDATKKRQSGAAAVGPTEPAPSKEVVGDIPDSDPLEYMLKRIEGKYDRTTKKKNGNTAHYFTKDGKTIVQVVIGASGIVKVRSSKVKGVVNLETVEKVLDRLL